MATPENILQEMLQPEATPTPPEQEPQVPEPVIEDPPSPEVEPEPTVPVKLADLARQLDMDPKDFFAAVNSDGMSADDAFKAAKSAGDLNAEREQFEQSQNGLRLEKAAALQEISNYVAALPKGEIDEQVAAKILAARNAGIEREQKLFLTAVEEWKDPAQKQADVQLMEKYIAQFHLTPADLAVVNDHRWMLMYRHVARQQQRLNEILDKAAKSKPKGQKKASVAISPSSAGTDITALVNANRN